jgi:hypothetical protein
MRTPLPVAGMAPTFDAPPATSPPSCRRRIAAGSEEVVEGSGRAVPPLPAPGVRTNGPDEPALSRQVPLNAPRVMSASTCRGRPPGAVTMFRPKPIVPSALGNAVPVTDAASAPPPHWSSVPSSRYTAPFCVMATVTTLQNGCSCQRNVPTGWASAVPPIPASRPTTANTTFRVCIRNSLPSESEVAARNPTRSTAESTPRSSLCSARRRHPRCSGRPAGR